MPIVIGICTCDLVRKEFVCFVLYLFVLTSCYYQIQETDEARKKFSNAKSISSAQFFGDHNKADADAQVSLQKFSVCPPAYHYLNINKLYFVDSDRFQEFLCFFVI